jgi:hypothetical protein
MAIAVVMLVDLLRCCWHHQPARTLGQPLPAVAIPAMAASAPRRLRDTAPKVRRGSEESAAGARPANRHRGLFLLVFL